MTAVGRDAGPEPLPFGASELIAAVAGARRVLDVGCGGGRLTVALAQAGAEVTGIDTSGERLEQARRRAARSGVALRLLEADLNEPLPFPDASFDAVVSRLALMIPGDTDATLRELRRVLVPDGIVATVLWASLPDNPWFAAPRASIAAVLGDERALFARAFGLLGGPDEAAAAHRTAGFSRVADRTLRERAEPADAAEHWAALARENGHFRRLDAALSSAERAAVVHELDTRLAPYREGIALSVPRTLVLVTARA